MKMPVRAAKAELPSHTLFRLTILLFAVLMCAQSVWLLLAELSRPSADGLPAAAAAVKEDEPAAARAAEVGVIRGDLWADSALTPAMLILDNPDASVDSHHSQELAVVHAHLDHALSDAPHQAGAWLLLAGLAARFASMNIDATEALKMSYYTGPSEPNLVPLRLRIAAQVDAFGDVEIDQLAKRDLRALLAGKQTSAIVDAYNAASPAGKHFIEQNVSDIDPSALEKLKTKDTQDLALPN